MDISKTRTLKEVNNKTLLDLEIKINHTPAEKLFIEEALKTFPDKITNVAPLKVEADGKTARVLFSLDTREITENEANSLVSEWIGDLLTNIKQKSDLLPVIDEVIRLNNRVTELEREIGFIKQTLTRRKIM